MHGMRPAFVMYDNDVTPVKWVTIISSRVERKMRESSGVIVFPKDGTRMWASKARLLNNRCKKLTDRYSFDKPFCNYSHNFLNFLNDNNRYVSFYLTETGGNAVC